MSADSPAPGAHALHLDQVTDRLADLAVAGTDSPQDAFDALQHAAARLLVRHNGAAMAQQAAVAYVGGFVAVVVHEIHLANDKARLAREVGT